MRMPLRRIVGATATVLLSAAIAVPSYGASAVSLSESSNGRTVRVHVGALVRVTLHSTYWQLATAPKASVLRPLGPVVSRPVLPGPNAPAGCRIPGAGCGTLQWRFRAVHVGSTYFAASRTTCGEAMRCTAAQSDFRVNVRVVR